MTGSRELERLRRMESALVGLAQLTGFVRIAGDGDLSDQITRHLTEVIEQHYGDDDLGDCPYLARYEGIPGHDPLAVCSYGCSDEPQCVTCTPRGGWPKFHTIVGRSVAE